MNSTWKSESLPEWQDYALVILSALVYPLIRFTLDTFLYQRLAERLVFSDGVRGFRKARRDGGLKKILKFMESAWKLTYYISCLAVAMLISYNEPWFGNTRAFWPGWPHQTLKFQLKLFYTLQCGFYVYSVVALLFWETRRKDFSVMMSHHVITIGLVSYSYITGSFRVGSIVLALHDVSDVLLEAAKLFKYSQKEFGATVLFGLFTLSWALLRLGYFPFWIITSTSYEVIQYLDKTNYVHAVHYYTFNTLLITLLVIHVYWWILICRMVSKQLQMEGKIPDDVRSGVRVFWCGLAVTHASKIWFPAYPQSTNYLQKWALGALECFADPNNTLLKEFGDAKATRYLKKLIKPPAFTDYKRNAERSNSQERKIDLNEAPPSDTCSGVYRETSSNCGYVKGELIGSRRSSNSRQYSGNNSYSGPPRFHNYYSGSSEFLP